MEKRLEKVLADDVDRREFMEFMDRMQGLVETVGMPEPEVIE